MHLILTQCFPPAVGGIENLLGGLAQSLAASGEKVLVFADAPAPADVGKNVFTLRRFGGIKIWRRHYKAFVANQLLQKGGVTQVFCDSWKSLEYLRRSSAKVAVFAHGSEYPLAPPLRKRQRIVAALAKADRILAVSRATRQRVLACGIATRIEVWHPPIVQPPQVTAKQQSQVSAIWGDSTPKLLTVGRLAERKGVDTAICVVAELVKKYPDLCYVVAGSGPQFHTLRELALTLGMHDKIKFIGKVSDERKAALYDSADIFLLCPRPVENDVEGFGLVFLEAAYFGLPAVTGSCGGATEAVDNDITGIHCDSADINQVCQALAALLSDSARHRRLSSNARQKARAAVWPLRVRELLK